MKTVKAYLVLAASAGLLSAATPASAGGTVLVDEGPWGYANANDLNNFADTGLGPTSNYTSYASATPGVVFSATNRLVMLEGGANTDTDLQNYLTANAGTIQSWVAGGGRLLIQSAGWDTSISVTLGSNTYSTNWDSSYNNASPTGQLTAAGQAAFGGVAPGISTNWSGNYLAHDTVSGPLTALMTGNTSGVGVQPIIGYTTDGSGYIMMSGLTDSVFHSGSGPWGNNSLVDAELLFLANGTIGAPGPVPGAGLAGLAALALAGLYARTRRA